MGKKRSVSFFTDKDYRKLFDKNQNVLLLIDYATGDILYANKQACEFYGYPFEKITNMSIHDINVLSEEEIKSEMESAFAEKRNYFNFIHRKKNGEKVHVEVNSTPVHIDDKDLLFSIITPSDIRNKNQFLITGLFHKSPNAMVILDEENHVMVANKAFTDMFGYTMDEMHGKHLAQFVLPDDQDVLINEDQHSLLKKSINKNEFRKTKDGDIIRVNIAVSPYVQNNAVYGTLVFYTDISEREEARKKIKETRDRLQLILDSAFEAIIGLDLDGKITFCNDSAVSLFGYEHEEELLEADYMKLFHHSYHDSKENIKRKDTFLDDLKQGKTIHIEKDAIWLKDGRKIDVEFFAHPQKSNGDIVGIVVTYMDITERLKYERYIEYLNYHDTLTDLYNRNYFEDKLHDFNHDESCFPVTIVFGDVNGLKLTNDIFGHKAGDQLIETAGNIMSDVFGDKGIVARVGGDEFAVLLPNMRQDETKKLVTKAKHVFKKKKIIAFKGSMSLGFATQNDIKGSLEVLMEDAEKNMYDDKIQCRSEVDDKLLMDIMQTIYEHNPEEKAHSEETSKLSEKIAEKMNLDKMEVNKIRLAGKYHDIGKVIFNAEMMRIGIPKDQKSINRFKQHAVIGYRILSLFDQTMHFAEDVLAHHERWNGSGYPYGLKGEEIPVGSRIIAVTEAFQRKTSDYSDETDRIDRVLKEIKKESGKKYDPRIVDVFFEVMREKEEKGG